MTRYQTPQICSYCNTHPCDIIFDMQNFETLEIREFKLCTACISAYDLITLNEEGNEIIGFGKDIKNLLS